MRASPRISTRADTGVRTSDMSGRPYDLSGWGLFALIGAAILIMSDVIILIVPGVTEATQVLIRATACTSFGLFLATLLAPSLAKRLPSGFTRALLRERRGLLLSSALSLLVNVAAVTASAVVMPDAEAGSGLASFESISTLVAVSVVALFLVCAALRRPVGSWLQPCKLRQAGASHQRISPRSQWHE